MAPDIRSFFGGKPAESQGKPAPAKAKPAAKKGRASRVVMDDSDDDEGAPPKKAAPKKAVLTKREATPEGEATTTSDFFADSKPKRSAPAKTSTPKSSKTQPVKTPPSGRVSTRKKTVVNYDEEKGNVKLEEKEEEDGKDDVFSAEFKDTGKGLGDDYREDDEDKEIEVVPKRVSRSKAKQTNFEDEGEDDNEVQEDDVDMQDVNPEDDSLEPDEDEMIEVDKPKAKTSKPLPIASRKRKTPEPDYEDEDDEDGIPAKKAKVGRKATNTKKAPAKKTKEEEPAENAEMQAIFDSIPTIRPPTPPPVDSEGKLVTKFDYRTSHANSGAAPAAGSKEIPTGAENCLSGLVFVFTGLLDTLSRDDGQALVKRYGGKVTAGPSKKTSYVVLGNEAGPKKLQVIAQYGLKTINEDGLYELIRRLPPNGGDSKAAAKHEEKKAAEMQKIKQMAQEMEREERRAGGAGSAGMSNGKQTTSRAATQPRDSQLWTVKHAPTQISQICGNKTQVEKLQKWLRAFPKNLKTGFKMAGADGSGAYRAVMIHGPPGIGKTTAAHLIAKLEGYDVVESNASDTRSKKLVESGLKGVLSTTSLLGYFAGDGQKVDVGKKNLVLIMDEVDGMSAGDRGGVGALAAVCKKTQVPMILICNDRKLQKMKPFDFCTYDLPFRRPTVEQIRSRILTIGFREQLKLPSNVVDALIEGSGADIRQVVNMVSTVKLDQQIDEQSMDFDRGKQMSKAWQKHVVLKPWDIISKILGSGMFAPSSNARLNDKSELYFNDHEFSYLMMQENYLGTTPTALGSYNGRERALKNLELVEQAANSISEGDLIDRMIHGPEQQWSLMPVHAIFSFVRPASFVAGSMAGHKTGFTKWLGQNSSQGKHVREIKEIQGHMRLRASGDRHEIRQQYVPTLWTKLVKKLEIEGKDSVPDVIELMDSYFLTRDDWDAIMDLGVGPMNPEGIKLDSQTKATFTRLYNQQSHPLPFMKASNVGAAKASSAKKEKPDLEEAIDESDDAEVVEEVKDEDEDEGDVDFSKDKYVKQPKKKKAAAAKPVAKGKGKKKTAAADDDDEEIGDSEEDVKPKKGKAKTPAKSRAKK